MDQEPTKRTGHTITGFSEAGFGCCGHYKFCEMGKSNCYYEVTDPAVKNCCAAYLRNQVTRQQEVIGESSLHPNFEELNKDVNQREEEQLSLF
ncbi:hypothetical protein [Sporosarcina sp. FSL K6-1508]|uniref:hypothetical protein n=1 Tax=Sporosarcina sp. FSL K6-1508 TaxID=2921553 RepID=UPI0030F51FF9